VVCDLTSGSGFEATYRALPEAAAEARAAVAALAASHGAGVEELDRIRLAVSEAVTNASLHAYRADAGGDVQVSAAVIDGELTVLVADEGCGLGAASESPGLGLGLGLIEQGCDSLSILARPRGGTELQMRFALPVASARAAGRGEPRAEARLQGSLTFAGVSA